MPRARSPAQLTVKSRCARNVIRGAARSPTATNPESRSLTTTVPALLTDPLYHVDGQQRGEVYNWGSFLQSKMHAKGVTCSDCHDPHTGKLRAEGNAICTTCHLATKYDTTEHHHHTPQSAGAACVACHMPPSTYMVVDPRHDHSLRVPRPDLSVTLGTPNACTSCHTKQDARWAATRVNAWYGHDPQGYQRFASAFSAARAGTSDGQSQLRAIASDSTEPAIVRATALAQIDASAGGAALETVAQSLRDASGLVRFGALRSLIHAPPSARVQLAAPLLSDPLRAARVEAVSRARNGPRRISCRQNGAPPSSARPASTWPDSASTPTVQRRASTSERSMAVVATRRKGRKN